MSSLTVSSLTECPACGDSAHRPSYLGEGQFEDFRFSYRECARCESLFVDPMPDGALLDRIYSPGYLGEHYASELAGESKSEELATEIDALAHRLAARRPGARLLDVGCGAGLFLEAARAAGLRVEGHERVPATAELTKRTVGVPVHSGELSSLEGGFDVIHFADVLEHCVRPLELLVAARGLLAPGGLIAARGPLQNHATLFQRSLRWKRTLRARLGKVSPTPTVPGHVVLFTLAGWHALLARAELLPVDEQVGELHWPAPERFAWRAVSVIKGLSIALTRSSLGRRLALGDRVVTLARPR